MVLTKAELLAAIVDMFAFNTTGAITDADARSVLTDMTDTMFDLAAGGGGATGQHARYVGWSDDRVIATADFAAANSAMTTTSSCRPRATNGYIWFAVPEDIGYPTDLHIAGGMRTRSAPTSGFRARSTTTTATRTSSASRSSSR